MKKIILVSSLLASVLYADFTMVIKGGEFEQTLQYKDEKNAKLTMSQEEGAAQMFIIGGKAYTLSEQRGEKVYYDVDEMRAMMGAMGMDRMVSGKVSQAKEEADIQVLKKKGSERVAGIKGRVWTVKYKDPAEGRYVTEDMVVTDDDDIVEAMQAWGAVLTRTMPTDEDIGFDDMTQIEKGYVVIKTKEFELASFKEGHIPRAEIQLPPDARKESMGGGRSEADMQRDREAYEQMMQERQQRSYDEEPSGAEEEEMQKALDEGMKMLKGLF